MKMFITYFQGMKKDFTNKVIKDPELNKAAHNFIQAQTDFAYMLLDNTECVMKHSFNNMSKGTKND